MTALWLFVRAISPRTWLVSLAIAAAVSAGAYARHWHISAVETARSEVRDSISRAAHDAAPAARETVYVAKEATNTGGRAAARAAAAVDTAASAVDAAVAAVPQALRDSVPSVDTLAQRAAELSVKSRALSDTTRMLWGVVMTERRAHEEYETRVEHIYVAVRDSLEAERHRPKRTAKSNAALVTVGAVAAVAVRAVVQYVRHSTKGKR